MNKENLTPIVQAVVNEKEEIFFQINCEVAKLYSVVISLVGEISEATGLEYNQVLEDITEVTDENREEIENKKKQNKGDQ